MANEITITASLTASKGGATIASGSLSKALDMAGGDLESRTIDVTQAAEVEYTVPTEIGNCGYVLIKNLDLTNFCTVGFVTGVANHVMQIPAGAHILFKPKTLTLSKLYLQADTADTKVQIWCVEE